MTRSQERREKLEALHAIEARNRRRGMAADAWAPLHERSFIRAGILVAATLLDAADEPELADWLHWAKPEYGRKVAAGVAAHALRRDLVAVWDALVVVLTPDAYAIARDLFDTEGCLDWAPKPEWLIEDARGSNAGG